MPKYSVHNKLTAWLLFLVLSLIWGSSFLLMKVGMQALSAYQVASLRIASASVVLLPFAWQALRKVERRRLPHVVLSGFLGSFFPAYLYCIAETRIDSSLAAILNSLTPLFTILAGIAFFRAMANPKQFIGVAVGFAGLVLLPFASGKTVSFSDLSYALFVLLATISYAFNINLVGRCLQHTGSLHIAAVAFLFLLLPAMAILAGTGFFSLPLADRSYLVATGASVVLGVAGTAIATVLFYQLVKNAGGVFASLVTYGIPVVAVILGLLYGEQVTVLQLACLGVILAGVYLVNRK